MHTIDPTTAALIALAAQGAPSYASEEEIDRLLADQPKYGWLLADQPKYGWSA